MTHFFVSAGHLTFTLCCTDFIQNIISCLFRSLACDVFFTLFLSFCICKHTAFVLLLSTTRLPATPACCLPPPACCLPPPACCLPPLPTACPTTLPLDQLVSTHQRNYVQFCTPPSPVPSEANTIPWT
jgi:hypothetical protein